MTELVKGSTELSNDAAADYAANLLRHYSFDLGDYTVEQLLSYWLEQYASNWVRLAAIEALYQGRYKAISVEQILALWQRRGQPSYHFNHEFERLVCDRFPRNLAPQPTTTSANGSKRPARLELPGVPISHQLHYLKSQLAAPPDTTNAAIAANSLSQSLLPTSPHGAAETIPESTPVLENDAGAAPEQPPLLGDRLADSPLGRALLSLPDIPPPEPAIIPATTPAETVPATLPEVDVVAIAHLLSLSLSSLTQPLQPKLKLHLTTLYQPNWLVPLDGQQRIHQFTPVPDASEFHTKLKAVAQPETSDSLADTHNSPESIEAAANFCPSPDAEVAPPQATGSLGMGVAISPAISLPAPTPSPAEAGEPDWQSLSCWEQD